VGADDSLVDNLACHRVKDINDGAGAAVLLLVFVLIWDFVIVANNDEVDDTRCWVLNWHKLALGFHGLIAWVLVVVRMLVGVVMDVGSTLAVVVGVGV